MGSTFKNGVAFSKWGLLLKERICFQGSKFFLLRVDSPGKGGNKDRSKLLPLKVYPFTIIPNRTLFCSFSLEPFEQAVTVNKNRFRWGVTHRILTGLPILLLAETIPHIWLLPRRFGIYCFLPRVLAGSRIMQTYLAGSHLSCTTVRAGSKQ